MQPLLDKRSDWLSHRAEQQKSLKNLNNDWVLYIHEQKIVPYKQISSVSQIKEEKTAADQSQPVEKKSVSTWGMVMKTKTMGIKSDARDKMKAENFASLEQGFSSKHH